MTLHSRVAGEAATGPDLAASYEHCRRIAAAHGRTYYLATLLLPAERRRHVYALYAFARYADEFVDSLTDPDPAGLVAWSEQALAVLVDGAPAGSDPILQATAHTAATLELDPQLFADFLAAMRADLSVSRYDTYEDLHAYMWGSAAVIGLLMLPVLGARSDAARAPAIALGEAFQLTNFIRDVGEDLQRGRIYLPASDLARFGVTYQDLFERRVTPAIRELLADQIARARALYAQAAPGLALVDPIARPCLATAMTLYGEILDRVEANDYDVFGRRAVVPGRRRLAVAGPAAMRALVARTRTRSPAWGA